VVTANPDGTYGNRLYALNAGTGSIVWGPIAVAGTYFGSGLTYANGLVFVLMFDGVVSAFNASNGAALWTRQVPSYWNSATPNAFGGLVFVAGNYGLAALDEATGAIAWTSNSGATTDWASPAVASEGVFIQPGNCTASALDPLNGTSLWQSRGPCDSPWGYASIVKNGTLFGRAGRALNLFDAATGDFLVQLDSDRAPAVTATAVIKLSSGTLASIRLSDRLQTWTFAGDGRLVTAPVVVNNVAFVGSSSGKVYGVDIDTGAEVWMGISQFAFEADSENGGPRPPSGPAAGENLLLFPAGNSLVAWQLR
jgi:outer membrane protein assembly factor BamB